jgi:pimeloyl-ACP methyl ester carboxylesterase
MDVGASFQFLVDAFARDWYAIAPDLRGYGRSEWQSQGYWFADYIADLEALVDAFAPGERVDLVGHSLGGNVVMMYAGARPARVRRIVSLGPAFRPSLRMLRREDCAWLDAP